jgi:hypothetical protein
VARMPRGMGPGPDRRAVPRPCPSRPRPALFRAGAGGAGSMTCGTRPVAGEGGRRERRGARVVRPEKERGGPSPDDQ